MTDFSYIIITDTDGEVPLSIVDKYELPFVPMPYILDGAEYFYDFGRSTDFKAFYQAVREGKMPSTYTYPPQYYVDMWTPYLEQGIDILFISFSSKLSAAYGFVSAAAEELREKYPQRKLLTVDTKAISGGMALLVYGALQLREQGRTIEETAQWVEEHVPHACHFFTVDDLSHLRRGGRLSAGGAAVGSMLKVKPLLHLDDEGNIVAFSKVMGRNKSIKALADLVEERAIDPEHNALIVLHGDCEEEGRKLMDMVQEKMHFKEVFFQYVGPVIGSHTGAGTLGICCLGTKR